MVNEGNHPNMALFLVREFNISCPDIYIYIHICLDLHIYIYIWFMFMYGLMWLPSNEQRRKEWNCSSSRRRDIWGVFFFWDSAGPLKASSMFWPLIELVSRIPCVKTEWYWVKSTMKYTHTMSWFQKHAHQRHELLHDIHMYIWRFLKMGVPQ